MGKKKREANDHDDGGADRASGNGDSPMQRAKIARTEQIPRHETMSLRDEFVGRSCKLFYKKDPLKIVKAEGKSRICQTATSLSQADRELSC